MITGATLFTGGGGVDIGMKMAGIDVRWGIEYDEQVASIATQNGFPVTVADITQCDPHNFERVDILHASPPCPSFSAAKTNGHETENDIALAQSVCNFIEVLQPAIFTLENVQAYDKSESYRLIVETLNRLGYGFNHWILNAADYGVPQTRVRMVVIALRSGKQPTRPPVTHVNPKTIVKEQLALFDTQLPSWIGWYEAIEDLIPTLPESKFADWQLKRLPEELKALLGSVLHNSAFPQSNGRKTYGEDESSFTVDTLSQSHVHVVLTNTQINAERGKHYREMEEPSETINVTHAPKGVIIDGKNSRSSDTERVNHITAREDFNPVWTVQSESHPNHFRAFLATPFHTTREMTTRDDDESSTTICASDMRRPANTARAFVVHPTDMRSMPTREEDDPCFTITAGSFKDSRECSWKPHAFILNGIIDNFVGDVTPDEQEKPARTVTASMYKHQPRAFIMPAGNSSGARVRDSNEPVQTQVASYSGSITQRALLCNDFLVSSQNVNGNAPSVREKEDASQMVGTNQDRSRALFGEQGRVVQMTPRALARFQSFPDWYELPDKKTLACKVIGNAVPPLLYFNVIKHAIKQGELE